MNPRLVIPVFLAIALAAVLMLTFEPAPENQTLEVPGKTPSLGAVGVTPERPVVPERVTETQRPDVERQRNETDSAAPELSSGSYKGTYEDAQYSDQVDSGE